MYWFYGLAIDELHADLSFSNIFIYSNRFIVAELFEDDPRLSSTLSQF